MLRTIPIVCLVAACLCAVAQDTNSSLNHTANATASRPIAYIYVSSIINPNSTTTDELYAFGAAANGRLTKLSGSPFAYNMKDMWVNSHYLFGLNGEQIDSYAIQSNGMLNLVATTDAASYASNPCGGIGPLKVDHSGADVYNPIAEGDCMGFSFQTFHINQTNGKLTYKSSSPEIFVGGSELDFLGNNEFAYSPVCTNFDHEEVGYIYAFHRAGDGTLTTVSSGNPGPTPQTAGNSYCPYAIATGPADHVAVLQEEEDFDSTTYGTPVIATYTASLTGTLSTTSTYHNMPHTRPGAWIMRMAPSGKLLAVGGQSGLEIFHYNGAYPATHYKTLLTSGSIQALYWDKHNHLYATEWTANGNGKLYVFTVTPTSASEAPGSPYAIPNPDSLIVRSE